MTTRSNTPAPPQLAWACKVCGHLILVASGPPIECRDCGNGEESQWYIWHDPENEELRRRNKSLTDDHYRLSNEITGVSGELRRIAHELTPSFSIGRVTEVGLHYLGQLRDCIRVLDHLGITPWIPRISPTIEIDNDFTPIDWKRVR